MRYGKQYKHNNLIQLFIISIERDEWRNLLLYIAFQSGKCFDKRDTKIKYLKHYNFLKITSMHCMKGSILMIMSNEV